MQNIIIIIFILVSLNHFSFSQIKLNFFFSFLENYSNKSTTSPIYSSLLMCNTNKHCYNTMVFILNNTNMCSLLHHSEILSMLITVRTYVYTVYYIYFRIIKNLFLSSYLVICFHFWFSDYFFIYIYALSVNFNESKVLQNHQSYHILQKQFKVLQQFVPLIRNLVLWKSYSSEWKLTMLLLLYSIQVIDGWELHW